MKMSDVFTNVAICTGGDGKSYYWTSMTNQEAIAAAHAISVHDELVEMLEECYKALFVDLTTDSLPSCSGLRSLLKKARGEA